MSLPSSRAAITKIVIALLAAVIISSVIVAYYAASYWHPNTSSTPTPTPTPTSPTNSTPTSTPSSTEQTEQEKIRDSIMTYIETNHPETMQFMNSLVWTGGRVTPANLVGAETYIYYSQGWNVTINYPVVPNPIYNVIADYSATGVGIPYRVIWQGALQNDSINETSYVLAQ